MKRALIFTSILIAILFVSLYARDDIAYAVDGKSSEDLEQDLYDAYDSAIDSLDLEGLQKFLNSLSNEGREAISISDVKSALKALARGESGQFVDGFFDVLMRSVADYFLSFLPSFMAIIILCLLKSTLSSLTSDFLKSSTNEVVSIVCYCAVVIVLMSGIATIVESVNDTISALTSLANVLFPLLLSLLSALGASASVGGYSPLLAVFGSFVMKIVTSVVLPAFIACIVFCVVGNVSKSVKLDKLAKFVKSASSWLIGMVFGLFATFLTMQGISGGVLDKFGFNVAKFAVSSYVPILGGYLSDGFDIMSASLTLVKNAVGYTGALILCASVVFPIVKVVAFSLAMKLTSAICEPIGDTRTATLLSAVAKNLNLLITVLAGVAFLFFLFLMLLISSCNMGV